MRLGLWLSILSVVALLATAAPDSQPVRIDSVAWLAGSWKGEAFGGEVEEIWSPPAGGMMMGMFRLLDKGKVAFSEFEQIVEKDNLLVFKVKHFTPAFVGWEEKEKAVEFRLLSAQEKELQFDGLTLVKIDADTCKHIIQLKDKATGQAKDVEILYRRVKN
jgi:Domain of unknown function (DUF6265)